MTDFATCSFSEYHATEATSNSRLKIFKESRLKFADRFVLKTVPDPGPTAAMRMGSMLNDYLLDPQRFDDVYAIEPTEIDGDPVNRRKPSHREWLLNWKVAAEAAGKVFAKPEEHLAAIEMGRAVTANKEAMSYLDGPGEKELALKWLDPDSGFVRKARIDFLQTKRRKGPIIVDIKTTKDIRPWNFVKAILNLGYHCQMAGYQDGYWAEIGNVVPAVVLIAVHNAYPWEVACYKLSDRYLEIGRERNRRDLRDLAECYDRNVWTNPEATGTLEIDAPAYAENNEQWEIER